MPLRTLDALHLSTLLFLMNEGIEVELATYDVRMSARAKALGIEVVELG